MPHDTIISCLWYMNDNENYITSWISKLLCSLFVYMLCSASQLADFQPFPKISDWNTVQSFASIIHADIVSYFHKTYEPFPWDLSPFAQKWHFSFIWAEAVIRDMFQNQPCNSKAAHKLFYLFWPKSINPPQKFLRIIPQDPKWFWRWAK